MVSNFVYIVKEKEQERKELNKKIEEFVNSGGKIKQLPSCKMTDSEEQRKNYKFVI